MICKYVVIGRERAHESSRRFIREIGFGHDKEPDVSIRCVSRVVGNEAANTLYAESVLRFMVCCELFIDTFGAKTLLGFRKSESRRSVSCLISSAS